MNHGRSLWLGVINQTLTDSKNLVEKAVSHSKKDKSTKLCYFIEMQQLEKEIHNKWFSNVCLLASVEKAAFCEAIEKVKKDGGWYTIAFEVGL